MDDYVPNPANYKMKENPKRDISESGGGYTKVLASFGGQVNPNDDTAVLDLIRKKLVLALEKSDNAREIVAVAGELMDRIEGKPMQRQQSMVAIAGSGDGRLDGKIEIIHVRPLGELK